MGPRLGAEGQALIGAGKGGRAMAVGPADQERTGWRVLVAPGGEQQRQAFRVEVVPAFIENDPPGAGGAQA